MMEERDLIVSYLHHLSDNAKNRPAKDRIDVSLNALIARTLEFAAQKITAGEHLKVKQ